MKYSKGAITYVYTGRSDLKLLWVPTRYAYNLTPFECLGDHGLYCPVDFGGL